MHRQILKNRFSELEFLVEQMEIAKQRMIRIGEEVPVFNRYLEVPGVAEYTASVFIAMIKSPFRFDKRSQVWKYCGIAVKNSKSDGTPKGGDQLISTRPDTACLRMPSYGVPWSDEVQRRKRDYSSPGAYSVSGATPSRPEMPGVHFFQLGGQFILKKRMIICSGDESDTPESGRGHPPRPSESVLHSHA